jgi:Flp pilus assembly secretin CpaC
VVNKVPLLGDIPLLGGLFRHTSDALRNNELLAFVTPYVVDANSLDAIPADLDDSRQLQEPRHKMENIQKELNNAMDWMSEEVIKEIEGAKPFNKKSSDDESDDEPEIKSEGVSEPGARKVGAADGFTMMYPAPVGRVEHLQR